MGTLHGPNSVVLRSRTLIGRSGHAELRIAHHSTSAEHAVIWWDGESWRVRDFDSRNGTHHNGVAVGSRDEPALEVGDTLRFGRGETWTVADIEPPEAVALCLSDGSVQTTSGVLALPSPHEVDVSVFRDHRGAWVVESEQGLREAVDAEELVVGTRVYRVYLPEGLDRTTLSETATLDASTLRIAHTVDEEHVHVRLDAHGSGADLGARAHHYLLLVLARLRVRDQASGLEEDRQGWVHRDVLLEMLKTDRKALNLQVFRLRESLGAAGVVDAAGIVERRRGNDQLRLGMERVAISTI